MMTPGQKEALGPYRKRLKAAFEQARPNAAVSGRARVWPVPYLAEVLKVYDELTNVRVDDRRLSRVLAKDPRTAILKLLKKSCDRNLKMKSRWAAALANAHQSRITPQQLSTWLRSGGGIAGRASEVSAVRHQASPEPNMSPQPISVPEAK